MGLHTFFGKGSHPYGELVCKPHLKKKIVNGTPKFINYCVNFMVYNQLTNVAAIHRFMV